MFDTNGDYQPHIHAHGLTGDELTRALESMPESARGSQLHLALEAEEIIRRTLVENGRGSLSCDSCDSGERWIDRDYNAEDTRRVAALVVHARYEHMSPRSILFTAEAVRVGGAL